MAPRVSTTDRIHLALREAILSGELASGSLHSIYQLAERFNVSRTPVRDAVLRLADTGMLEIERNHGVRVRGLKVDDVREVFEARLLLEVPAAAFAATHADDALVTALRACLLDFAAAVATNDEAQFQRSDRQLHTMLMAAAGNTRISAMVESLRDVTQAHGVWTADQSRTLRAIQHEHEPIVDAVAARNPDAAARLMRDHLVETAVLLMQQVAKTSGEAVPDPWPGALISRARGV
ncbi:GntR family transcriptional regulator [Cryobacterium sp. PH29-G1]|uniref:GntR family transcriptional regulator n=1 Tax=Cryobacterium sp. PH29-G1 TaxID=3046211 RepID=UPI0024BAB0F6|nr:GntR family transcriptional regulator [Cryobacterium sp. PH29-G1]MDJ0348849.1 GntR family transcriptional regulator [Cryobacterium sp. PH29-G1]